MKVTTLFCTDMYYVYFSRINEDRRFFLLLSGKKIRGTALWIVAIESFGLNSPEIWEKYFESHFHVSVTCVVKEMGVVAVCRRHISVPSVITEVIPLLLTSPRNTKI